MTGDPKIGSKSFFSNEEVSFRHMVFSNTVHITMVDGQCQARNWKIGIFWEKFGFWKIFKARGLDLKIGSGEWGGNDYVQRYKNHPLPILPRAGTHRKILAIPQPHTTHPYHT